MSSTARAKALFAAAATTTVLMTAACGSSTESSESSSGESSAQSESSTDQIEVDGELKAGEYKATGSYSNPSGTSSVEVDMTLDADGTVTAVTVTPLASGTSLQYQEKFVSGIDAEVVGKKISDLSVDKVAGSSLTGNGFNSAVRDIVAEAQA